MKDATDAKWISPFGDPCPEKVKDWLLAREARKAPLAPTNILDVDACNWARQRYLDAVKEMEDREVTIETIESFTAGFFRAISWFEWQRQVPVKIIKTE